MEGVPFLSAHDLRAELAAVYQATRHHHLFAYFGTGEEAVLDVGDTQVQVVPVRSELELREKMPPLEADGTLRVAFLVPWTHDVPLDLAGRFMLKGRVRKIGKASRLCALFGVGEVDEDARKSPLAELLLRSSSVAPYKLAGESRLTMDLLWSAWLKREWGLDTDGGLALDALLAFVATSARGPSFFEAMQGAEGQATREALLAWLARTLGPCGPALWRAWEMERGRRAIELAIVLEPLAESPRADVRMWAKTKTRELLSIADDAEVSPVIGALARSVAGALRILERSKELASEARAWVRAADALVVDDEVRASLVESKRLPSAWTARLDALGLALEAGAEAPSHETTARAVRALRALEPHAFFKDPEQRHVLERAEMAVRLLAWLAARPDQKVEPGLTSHGDAEALGEWYAREGGYVDRARRRARGSAEAALGRGAQRIAMEADQARAALDLRFARSLSAWVDSGQPSSRALPIHDAVKRIAARFLEGHDRRRLLVLLMDGMAWAQATELLESLGAHAAPWGPLTWHTQKGTRITDESPVPVVFAALPTVTEVSRSAFFGGKPLGPGAKLTTPDPDHWAAHPSVKRLVDAPRLLLRSEGRTKAGGASEEALSLVADPKRRVVAMVINAIDDSLKASHEVRHPWDVRSIESLPDLLQKAREHGRSVLLASDHGHVPADRLQRVAAASPALGARWRAWPTPSAEVKANEVAFSGTCVYTPPGAHGVVLLADDASCYTGSTQAGQHGGATLAEVVAPCLLIGCEDAARDDDPALEPRAAYVPSWWHFEVSAPVVAPPEPAPPKKPTKNVAQLPLLPPVEPPRSSAAPPPPALAGSAVLGARAPAAALRQQVVEAVEVLLARNDVMSRDAFAAAMHEMPFRVGGLVSKLQEVLNLDGYVVLRFDPGTRQVHLDRAKLAQLFEVKL